LAEGIARKILAEAADVEMDVSSAGSSAMEDLPASPLAVEVARRHSIDLSKHRTRLLDGAMVRDADLIVAMGSVHRDSVGLLDPSAVRHTYLMTDFCDREKGDIADPIGQGIDDYEETYLVLEECIRAMAAKLDSFEGWKK
jgi:protein-tyrosine phosphatase